MRKKTNRTGLMTRRTAVFAMVISLLLVSGIAVVLSQTNNTSNNVWYGEKSGFFLGNLTSDQRDQLFQTISQLKSSGATPQEIQANVTQTLQGFGINVTS